jgi:hypothetical protein
MHRTQLRCIAELKFISVVAAGTHLNVASIATDAPTVSVSPLESVLPTGRTKSLAWPGPSGLVGPGGARPNAQCSVDCSQIGIGRSPRAPDHILSSSSILSIRLPNLRAIG